MKQRMTEVKEWEKREESVEVRREEQGGNEVMISSSNLLSHKLVNIILR